MQKALNQMNLHLHHVISDITGVTGMKIIRSILDGQRDPKVLATFRDRRIKASEETIAKAMDGNYLEEHLFTLQQNLQLYNFYQQQLKDCDQQIEQVLQSFPTLDDIEHLIPVHLKRRRRKKKGANAPKFDSESYINQITGCNLFDVPGFGENNLLLLISETGIDMDKWKTEKHFTSWLRLAPNNKISGGKILSRQTQKTKNRANLQFRLAAQSLANSQCALGAFYRRLRYRIGPSKANVAVARKLAIIYYRMLKFKMSYQEMSAEKYDAIFHAKQVKNLKKRAKELGFELVQA
jgi:transposase